VPDISSVLIDRVADWLMSAALAGTGIEDIVSGFCERLAAAGAPIARIHLSISVLHPLYRATGFLWRRGEGLTAEKYRHNPGASQTERFRRSPYFYLLDNNLDHLRRRIDGSPSEFPIIDDLKEQGMTDYLAFVHPFNSSFSQAMMGSWSTDRSGGFSEAVIAALLRIQNQLAVAVRMAVLGKLAGNMLSTYLGYDAGRRVLSGQIKRGDGETIRAALVMADMRNSSMLADRHGRQIYIDTLNQFFDAIAEPFNRNGGQILGFLGDGFLAIYPCDRHKVQSQIACRSALAAAGVATGRMTELNRKRASQGLAEVGYGIGLHVGNVMFGNVGLADRLAFSSFGAAVNEVQRLESLTKRYPSKIVVSEDFANYCGGEWTKLGAEKLRGREQAVKVYAPVAASIESVAVAETAVGGEQDLSDAEQLVILHRESQKAADKMARN
jgi:adenylate cyclase